MFVEAIPNCWLNPLHVKLVGFSTHVKKEAGAAPTTTHRVFIQYGDADDSSVLSGEYPTMETVREAAKSIVAKFEQAMDL